MRPTILVILLFTCQLVFSQTKNGEITYTKTFWGYWFHQNGKQYRLNGIMHLIEQNKEAYDLMKQSIGNASIANVISFIGGGLMGWPVGGLFAGKEMDWKIFAAGAAVTALSIPISISSDRKLKKSIEVWNASLATKMIQKNNFAYDLKVSPGRVGLTVSF